MRMRNLFGASDVDLMHCQTVERIHSVMKGGCELGVSGHAEPTNTHRPICANRVNIAKRTIDRVLAGG